MPDDAREIMTNNVSIYGLARHLGVDIPCDAKMRDIQLALDEDLASIELFPDTLPTLEALRSRGLKLAICSNLAAPYGPPVRELLPMFDLYAWSYRIRAIKPEPEVYELLIERLGMPASEILFVGDTHSADVAGPRSAGMQALHLARNGVSPDPLFLRSLDEILEINFDL